MNKLALGIFIHIIILGWLEGPCVAETFPYKNITLNQTIQSSLASNRQHNYILEVVEAKQEFGILIDLQGLTPLSEPGLRLKKTHNYAFKDFNDEQSNIHKSYDGRVTIYQSLWLEKQPIWHIIVHCKSECTYQLSSSLIYYQAEIALNEEKFLILSNQYASQNDQGQGRALVKVDPAPNVTDLIIEFELMNSVQMKKSFSAFINFEKQEWPAQSSQYTAETRSIGLGSGSGMGMVYKSNEDICGAARIDRPQCSYRILFLGDLVSIIRIRTIAYSSIRKIAPFEIVNDYVNASSGSGLEEIPHKIFELDLESSRAAAPELFAQHKDLQISLVTYMGDANIFVHYDALPAKLSNYHWSSESVGDDRIVISTKEVEAMGGSGKKYFIAVAARSLSFFTLKISIAGEGTQILSFNYPESGNVARGGITAYKLFVWSELEQKITITLKSQSRVPKVCLLLCQDLYDPLCTISSMDLKNVQNGLICAPDYPQILQIDHGQHFCDDRSAGQTTERNSATQEQNSPNRCGYKVAVYGSNNATSPTTNDQENFPFVLSATHNVNHVLLTESHPFHDSGELGVINYYKFNYKKQTSSIGLSFIVTKKHGEVTLFVSTSEQYPTVNSNEKLSFWNSITIASGELISEGAYFLGVQCDSDFNEYSVEVVQQLNATQNKSNMSLDLRLKFLPYNEYKILDLTNPIFRTESLYFFINETGHPIQSLHIFTQPLENCMIQISCNQKVIQSAQFDWAGQGQIFLQRGELEKCYKNGSQMLYGFATLHKSQAPGQERIPYRIKYVYDSDIRDWASGEVIRQQIKMGQEHTYRFKVNRQVGFTISKKNHNFDQSDVSVFVVISPLTLKPSRSAHDFQVEAHSPLMIMPSDIALKCYFLTEEDLLRKNCHIYVTVVSRENTTYELFVDQNNDKIMLFDDTSFHITLSQYQIGDESGSFKYKRDLYYFVNSEQQILIHKAPCLRGHNIYLYGSLLQLTDAQRLTWSWPTAETAEFTLGIGSALDENSLTLTKEAIHSHLCAESSLGCVLLLTALDKQNTSHSSTNLPVFHISIARHVRYLTEGQGVLSMVEEDEIQYFEVATEYILRYASITVTCTIINNGKVQMFAGYGATQRPTSANTADWFTNGSANTLLISSDMLDAVLSQKMSGRGEGGPEREGSIIVGVQGKLETTHFRIIFTTQASAIQNIDEGWPQDFYLEKPGESNYFIYTARDDAPFKILLARQVGRAIISVNLFHFLDEELQGALPTPLNSLVTNNQEVNKDYLLVDPSKLWQDGQLPCTYDTNCQYIVGLQALSITLGSLLVNGQLPIYLPLDRLHYNYLPGEGQLVKYFVLCNKNYDLFIKIYKGEAHLKMFAADHLVKHINVQQSNFFQIIEIPTNPTESEVSKPVSKLLIIESTRETLFSAYTHILGDPMAIFYGQPVQLSLVPGITQKLKLTSDPNKLTDLTEVVIKSLDQISTHSAPTKIGDILDLEIFYLPLFYAKTYRPEIDSVVHSEDHYYLSLKNPNILGDYEIRIKPKMNLRILVSVVDNQNVNYLIPNLTLMGQLKKFQKKLFQLNLEENCTILIELSECKGKLLAYASSSYEGIINEIYDVQFSHRKTGIVTYLSRAFSANQTVYIVAKSYSEEALFQIRVEKIASTDSLLLDPAFFLYDQPLAVDGSEKSSNLTISLPGIQCLQNTHLTQKDKDGLKILYKLYATMEPSVRQAEDNLEILDYHEIGFSEEGGEINRQTPMPHLSANRLVLFLATALASEQGGNIKFSVAQQSLKLLSGNQTTGIYVNVVATLTLRQLGEPSYPMRIFRQFYSPIVFQAKSGEGIQQHIQNRGRIVGQKGMMALVFTLLLLFFLIYLAKKKKAEADNLGMIGNLHLSRADSETMGITELPPLNTE